MNELKFMYENIFGIYNYCDRWCEKCTYTNRCLLFKQEVEREIKYILTEENKNDPEVLVKDLENDTKASFDHINKYMTEEDEVYEDFDNENDSDEGFFKEDVGNDDRPSTFLKNAENPLILLSEKLFKEFYKCYDLFKTKFADELDEKNPESFLQQNLDTLGWYTPQIHVKIRMCYWNRHKLSKTKDPGLLEIDEEMLTVSARIAFVGIENCIRAFNNLIQQKIEPQSEMISLLTIIKQIKAMFVAEFPAALTYKRPYFD